MQFLLFWEEKFYASCTLKDKNFAPKQNERDCPMTGCLFANLIIQFFVKMNNLYTLRF